MLCKPLDAHIIRYFRRCISLISLIHATQSQAHTHTLSCQKEIYCATKSIITMQSAINNGAPITGLEYDEFKVAATSIYHVADVCFDYFEHLISIGDVDPLIQQTYGIASDIENKVMLRDVRGIHNSFAFWVDYTGALAAAGASLDNRLQDHVEIKEMVLELLEMVARNLYRCECSGLFISVQGSNACHYNISGPKL